MEAEKGTEEAVPAVEKKDDAVAAVEVTVTTAEEVKVIADEPQPLKEETKSVNETSSPVLNGVSEAKEEITAAVEKESEKIVETVPEAKEIITATESPVIENKTPEPVVTNGDKHHDEISSKTNGSFEAPKTEVKNDDILIEKELQILNIIKEQNDENIVQNINSTNELKNLDGESTLPIPPPLPSTLPPSQVMVFALSETTQEQKNNVILPLDTDIPIYPPPVVEKNLILNKLDDVNNISKNDINLVSNDVINNLKNDECLINEISTEKPSEVSLNKEKESLGLGEIKIDEIIENNEIIENIDIEYLEESPDEISNEKLEVESVQSIDQIVDDITQVVAADKISEQDIIAAQVAVENILKENSLSKEATEVKEEKESTKIVEEVIILQGITPNEFLDNIINQKTTYDETSTSMDSQSQNENGKTTESSADDDLPSPPPTPPAYFQSNSLSIDNANKVSDINIINENFDKMSLENDENKTDLIASDLSSKSNNDVTDTPDDDTINITKAGGQKQQNQNNKKENGVDENHQNNEKSATENLNGVDHNKTIEEIKAENQQLDKSAAEITQDTAIIAAE